MPQIVRVDNLGYWVFDMCSCEIKDNSTGVQGYTQVMELKWIHKLPLYLYGNQDR